MRMLAAELGIEAMSLYYHVKSKDDIFDGMFDVVNSEFATPRAGDERRTAMRERAESMRIVFAQHPWAISIKALTSPGHATLGHLDSAIGCLTAAGFSMPMTGHAMSILDSSSVSWVSRQVRACTGSAFQRTAQSGRLCSGLALTWTRAQQGR